MTDRERLLQTLAAVYAFYEREISELAIGFWLDDLAGHQIADIERAFAAHRRDPERGQYLPKPADILRRLQGDSKEPAMLAWSALIDQVRSVGSYNRPRLDAVASQAVDALGGWGAICRADESSLPFLQRRFLEAFATYRDRAQRGDGLGLLSGAATLRLQ